MIFLVPIDDAAESDVKALRSAQTLLGTMMDDPTFAAVTLARQTRKTASVLEDLMIAGAIKASLVPGMDGSKLEHYSFSDAPEANDPERLKVFLKTIQP